MELYSHWADVPPAKDVDSELFWAGIERGELLVSRCGTCKRLVYPETSSCPHCGTIGETRSFESIPPTGLVYTWTTVHVALDPAFKGETPYTVLAVDFGPDVRILGRLLDKPDELRGDSEVYLVPYKVGAQALPGFRFTATQGRP